MQAEMYQQEETKEDLRKLLTAYEVELQTLSSLRLDYLPLLRPRLDGESGVSLPVQTILDEIRAGLKSMSGVSEGSREEESDGGSSLDGVDEKEESLDGEEEESGDDSGSDRSTWKDDGNEEEESGDLSVLGRSTNEEEKSALAHADHAFLTSVFAGLMTKDAQLKLKDAKLKWAYAQHEAMRANLGANDEELKVKSAELKEKDAQLDAANAEIQRLRALDDLAKAQERAALMEFAD